MAAARWCSRRATETIGDILICRCPGGYVSLFSKSGPHPVVEVLDRAYVGDAGPAPVRATRHRNPPELATLWLGGTTQASLPIDDEHVPDAVAGCGRSRRWGCGYGTGGSMISTVDMKSFVTYQREPWRVASRKGQLSLLRCCQAVDRVSLCRRWRPGRRGASGRCCGLVPASRIWGRRRAPAASDRPTQDGGRFEKRVSDER